MEVTDSAGTVTRARYVSIDGAQVATITTSPGGTAVAWNCASVQNSTICQADTTTVGTIPARTRYLPYGGARNTTTFTNTDHRFLSQPDDTTGLTYLNNRYYDPTVGVFTSVDPLVGKTGTAYLYAAGNPATLSDPSGLCTPHPSDWMGYAFDYGACAGALPSRGDLHGVGKDAMELFNTMMASASYYDFKPGPDATDEQWRNFLLQFSIATDMTAGYASDYVDAHDHFTYADIAIALDWSRNKTIRDDWNELGLLAFVAIGLDGEFAPADEPQVKIGSDKILDQMGPRGWTEKTIQNTVANPTKAYSVWDFTTGSAEAATAYENANGGYVVVNNASGTVVQVSDMTVQNWKPVWDSPRFQR